jgi:hypothetical protein
MPFSFKRFHKVSPAILEIIQSTSKAGTARVYLVITEIKKKPFIFFNPFRNTSTINNFVNKKS